MTSPANWIWEQEEQYPSQVVSTGHEIWTDNFLAVGLTLHILQLNMDSLFAATNSIVPLLCESFKSSREIYSVR